MSVCVYVCAHLHVHLSICIRIGDQRAMETASIMWFGPGAKSAFTLWAILPVRSWVLNVTLLMKPQFFKVSEKKKKIRFFWEGCQEIDPVQDTGWTSALQPAAEDSACLEYSEYYFAATRQTFSFDFSHKCHPLKSQSDEVRLNFDTMHMYANEITELILCIQPYARVHWNEKQSAFT